MGKTPSQRLDAKVKNVWRINDAIGITILVFSVSICFLIVAAICSSQQGVTFTLLITGVIYVILLVIWLIILPPIRYARWRYELSPEYLEIVQGIIWRKHYVIPFIRVQNTDTRQGPILRAFNLASVTIATAAGNHEIPGLSKDIAEHLRDKAAEFARLAHEDV